MINGFKSKTGIVFAGIYLFFVIFALIDYALSPPVVMGGFALLILTAPWGFFLGILLDKLGVLTPENGDSFLPLLVMFGGLINASILSFLGHLLEKIVKYFFQHKTPK